MVRGEAGDGGRILIGHCPTAAMAPVHADPDKLFGRHLAVLGNTGAGKSCTVAGLVRWSLKAAREERLSHPRSNRPNARFIVLDPNGEYSQAFKDLGARVFQVDPPKDGRPLRVPAWLWNGAEWAAFATAAPGVQRPLLFEALRCLRSGVSPPNQIEAKIKSRANRYRLRIRELLANGEHQGQGKRESGATVLLNIAKDFRSFVNRPDCCDGAFKSVLCNVVKKAESTEQCARSRRKRTGGHWHNDFSETDIEAVGDALRQVAEPTGLVDEEQFADVDSPISFPVSELPGRVDALAADRAGRDIAQFVDTLNLRIRELLTGGRLKSVLHDDEASPTELADWLRDYIGANQASNGPIAVLDLSLVPSEVTRVVVTVLARVVFEALQRYRLQNGSSLPTALVLEEAHTFIHQDLHADSASPAARECTSVFERIAREGRKFGLGLVLSTQRPSEISPTVLSQCNTFLLHRLVSDRDQDLVRRLVPDGLGNLLRELPSLPTRRAILLGWAAPAPMLVEVQEIPEASRPHSPDPAFWKVWTGHEKRTIKWCPLADQWTGRPDLNSCGQSSE